ncbi:hypothetical protein Aperf_G00000015352 [Anoplocephala perfoliata]
MSLQELGHTFLTIKDFISYWSFFASRIRWTKCVQPWSLGSFSLLHIPPIAYNLAEIMKVEKTLIILLPRISTSSTAHIIELIVNTEPQLAIKSCSINAHMLLKSSPAICNQNRAYSRCHVQLKHLISGTRCRIRELKRECLLEMRRGDHLQAARSGPNCVIKCE